MEIARYTVSDQNRQVPTPVTTKAESRSGNNVELAFQREVVDSWLARAGMLHADAPLSIANRR